MTFNTFNNLPIKFLTFIVGVLATLDLCIHACHATQYARLDEAYAHPTLHEEQDSPQMREAKLDHALSELSRIQRIYHFDSAILVDDGSMSDPSLDFSGTDLQQALSLQAFYSEQESERRYAFERSIKQPMLGLLKDAAEASYKFPQTLGDLSDHRVTGAFQELLDIAIRDLFTNPVEGLPALSGTLNGLKANKKLKSKEERKLRLFINLAGFFYDRKAIRYLQETNETVLGACHDVSQPSGRIAVLRALQIHGEVFKLMLPSTLNLDPTMPSEGLLEGLRDTLSHLSRMKVEKLFSPAPETTAVFKGVLVDIARLNDGLKSIEAQYHGATSMLSPAQQWEYIKSLSSTRIEPQPPSQWAGIDSLLNLLELPTSSSSVALLPLSYAIEIDGLIPLPTDRAENEEYFRRRTKIYDILNRKGKALGEPKQSHMDLLACGAKAEESRTEVIFTQLKSAQEELSQLYATGKRAEGEQKKKELTELMNQLVLELMGVSQEQNRTYEERREIIRKEEERRQDLRRLLDQTKPCRGFGNLSDKYEEFCDKLRGIGIALPSSPLDWNKDPETIAEKTFHKAHQTGLTSKQTKDALRRDRIQSLLEFINFLRTQLGIKTSLEFEGDKETHKIIIEGKAKIISDRIHALGHKKGDAIGNLWEIQGKLYALGNEVLTITTPDELVPIQDHADQYSQAFLSQYETYLSQSSSVQLQSVSDLKQELFNKGRGLKTVKLRAFIKKQQVQSNHRFSRPTLVEEKLKRQLEVETASIPTYEFLVGYFYELFKEVNDYPELDGYGLRDTDQIRNHLFHADPFKLEPLRVKSSKTFDSGTYLNNSKGELAKELGILVINVRYLLEEFLRNMK